MEHVTPADRTPDAVAPDHADDLALALRLADTADAVSYTHLTLPTILLV